MINIVFNAVISFFTLALTAVTVQNAVLARAFGVSRLISLMDDRGNAAVFGALLTASTTVSSALNYFANRYFLTALSNPEPFRPLSMVACMTLSFFLVYVLAVKFAPYRRVSDATAAMPLAAFNCTILGTLLIETTRQLPLYGALGYGIGSGLGFMLAVLLVAEGRHIIQNDAAPEAFRGLPVTLLYIAGLALALYGLNGFSF